MNVNFYIENDVGLFHPYDDSELNINFYGRDSIPDEFRGINWLADASRTNINFIQAIIKSYIIKSIYFKKQVLNTLFKSES